MSIPSKVPPIVTPSTPTTPPANTVVNKVSDLSSHIGNPSQTKALAALGFSKIQSNKLVPLKDVKRRNDFWKLYSEKTLPLKPVVIAYSSFVPPNMVEHLMRNKKYSALSQKFVPGDKITNMEGALHTFVAPVCPITMLGDYAYKTKHDINSFKEQSRNVILSASVHPDFEMDESDEVVMRIVEIKEEECQGEDLGNFTPLWKSVNEDLNLFRANRAEYSKKLQKHMIFHLTAGHRLPSLKEIDSTKILSMPAARALLEKFITDDSQIIDLKNAFVRLKKHIISLEALFNIYVHQLRNEFSILETQLTQGYVYTVDPPRIFAAQIGMENVCILNRLQILALKFLKSEISFVNLKRIGFNDFDDKPEKNVSFGAVALLNSVFPNKALSKKELFVSGHYSVNEDYALVIHNNSDAFGQNIQSEGPSSLDGVIGTYSDASCQLDRARTDLVKHLLKTGQ